MGQLNTTCRVVPTSHELTRDTLDELRARGPMLIIDASCLFEVVAATAGGPTCRIEVIVDTG